MLHDRERAWQGVNLYTNDRDQAFLMDMDGKRLHTWRLPETEQHHCEYAELLDDGDLAVVWGIAGMFIAPLALAAALVEWAARRRRGRK